MGEEEKDELVHRSAIDMMKKCIKCDLFEHCYQEEVDYLVDVDEEVMRKIASYLVKLGDDIKMNQNAIKEFCMNTMFFILWMLKDKNEVFICHHDHPHEIPPDLGSEFFVLWSPGVNKNLSRLMKRGLVKRSHDYKCHTCGKIFRQLNGCISYCPECRKHCNDYSEDMCEDSSEGG